jgi:hypothetical protein
MDPDSDPDPAIFVADLQEANTKTNLKKKFPADYFLKLHIHHLFKEKSPKEVTLQNTIFA